MTPPDAGRYISADGDLLMFPARWGAWLLRCTDVGRQSVAYAGVDAEVDACNHALKFAAQHHVNVTAGSNVVDLPGVPAEFRLMSTTAAANRSGLTDRAIRLACSEGRLPATKDSGRWLVTAADVDAFCADRVM